jgi:hypothetical protein
MAPAFRKKARWAKDIPLGARVLRILNHLAERTRGDAPLPQNFDELLYRKDRYDLDLLAKLRSLLAVVDTVYDETVYPDGQELVINIKELRVGDYLLTDLETTEDRILLTHGNFISEVQLQRLRTFERLHKFREPIEVRRGGKSLKRGKDVTSVPASETPPARTLAKSSQLQEPKA